MSKVIYMVFEESVGLFGSYFDQQRATQAAEAVHGVVVEMPIFIDFRVQTQPPNTSWCWRCKEFLPVDSFYKSYARNKKRGYLYGNHNLQRQCKKCDKELKQLQKGA
jgi:hypothetical protein